MRRFAGLPVLLAIFLAIPAAGAGLSVGLVGGSNRSSISGDKPERGSYQGAMGYQVGVALDVDIGDHVVLTLQPSFVGRNTALQIKKPTVADPTAKEVFRIGMDHVTVPLLAQYVFGERGVRFFITGGVEVLYRQDARLETPDGTETNITGEIAKTEAVLDVGLGLRFLTGPVRWSVEARFGTGMTDLAEGDPLGVAEGADVVWKSRSTQLLASATYPLSR